MRKKISKLKWNFFSILITVILGLGIYHIYLVPKANEYKIIDKIEIKVICKLKNNVPIFKKDFCPDYQISLNDLIKEHLTNTYTLSEEVYVKFKGPISYYTIKTSNFKYDTEHFDSLNKIILYQSDIFKNQMNMMLTNENTNFIINGMENLKNITKLSNDKLFQFKYKEYLKIKEIIIDNIEQFTRLNKTYKDLKPEQMYSLKIKKDQIKSFLYSKYKRLNYINVFISSFIFGIFINILFALIIEIKKLYKW